MKRIGLMFTLFISHLAHAQSVLSMDRYLDQVRGENRTYQGSIQYRDGAKGRAAEADLVTSYRLTGLYQYEKDQSIPSTPIVTYDSMVMSTYSLGLEKTTTFGLDAKLSYDINSLKYVNSNIQQIGGLDSVSTATPTLKLSQSLWQNGFGRQTRASVEAKSAQAVADLYSSQSTVDTTIQSATTVYWNLVLQREIVAIRKLAVKQAQSVFDYNAQRAKMNLGEEADVYTAKALLESRNLDLQSAVDSEETAIREFNQYRNRPPTETTGDLDSIDWQFLIQFRLPSEHSDRADVTSARFQAVANSANLKLASESDLPVLNAVGSYAMNGRDANVNDSIANANTSNRPTTVVGVNLSLPLDFASMNKAKQGARVQAKASDLLYQQKALDQEADWADINAKLSATQRRIVLAGTIEEAQKTKLEFEKKRLRQGRTSTYQVMLYEQDYTTARLTRVQAASDMISLLSRARLYSHAEQGAL